MPIQPGEPLRKVTLNLFDADVEDLGLLHGHGWSTIVRDLVRDYVKKQRRQPYTQAKTIGDFLNE